MSPAPQRAELPQTVAGAHPHVRDCLHWRLVEKWAQRPKPRTPAAPLRA